MKDYSDMLGQLKEKPPRKLNDHVLLVDGMNMLIRSFSLIKTINPAGHHVGGLIGFLRSLNYVTRIIDPTRVIIVWDGKGGSANRKNIDSNYKAQRATSRITHWGLYETKAEESEALIAQLYRLQDYLECLPVHTLMMEKLEADDIIAYLANQVKTKVTIVSSDKDFLQLVSPTVEVYAPVKKKTFTVDNIQEELKVLPDNYNLVKALMGDKSDNLAGVKGLGIKTIVRFFPDLLTNPNLTLDYIYDICEANLEKRKVFANIIHQWDRVEKNYQLMDLHENMLDDREKDHIFSTIKSPIPSMQTGGFLHLLDVDKVEGITKNTEGWLQTFASLSKFNK